MQRKPSNARRLIVPLVLAVTVVVTAAAVATTGCGTDKPKIDASVGDGGIDTPVV